jgi:hypothetical protein
MCSELINNIAATGTSKPSDKSSMMWAAIPRSERHSVHVRGLVRQRTTEALLSAMFAHGSTVRRMSAESQRLTKARHALKDPGKSNENF